MSCVGMMQGAFFKGRAECLRWVNETLDTNLSKVEQCSNGAVYCQLIDSVHYHKVRLQRIDWNATQEYAMEKNYKILQEAFNTCGISKHIEVQKLVRSKPQDNLEMLQWIMHYHEVNGGTDANYEPAKRRLDTSTTQKFPEWAGCSTGSGVARAQRDQPSSGQGQRRPHIGGNSNPGNGTGTGNGNSSGYSNRQPASGLNRSKPAGGAKSVEVREMKQRHTELEEEAKDLEHERNFYYGKLRNIEVKIQEAKDAGGAEDLDIMKGLVSSLEGILYEEDNEDPNVDTSMA